MRLTPRLKSLIGIGLLGICPLVFANSKYNMHPGVSPIAQQIYGLHMTILYICIAIAVIVFSVMFYAIIFHRKSVHPVPANFHENTTVEILWTIIPLVLMMAMIAPATRTLLAMNDFSESDYTIKITGYQWHWEYDYHDMGVRFSSYLSTPDDQIQNRDVKGENYLLEVDEHLVLPVNKKIRFLTTSNDVIHAWWVRHLGVKKDAIPGYINETWTKITSEGTYRGQCAELCGLQHAFMPIVVEAVSQEKFDAWLAEKKAAAAKANAT